MEEEYKQSRERELLLTRQSRDDFEGWWECAKETLKETEVGIQKVNCIAQNTTMAV